MIIDLVFNLLFSAIDTRGLYFQLKMHLRHYLFLYHGPARRPNGFSLNVIEEKWSPVSPTLQMFSYAGIQVINFG